MEHMGVKWVKMKISQLFFALIEAYGCKFKLNFDGEGVKNCEKNPNLKNLYYLF
jgi:hypothetical protein